ncbi:hypothetical protein [Chryseobacterium potabilaquae]|uniref:Uncharacterized protein n=1 Tax=Chryseobacterium potabilaquae TaxID=2675057 RepID=A0A6N4XCG4_9FLAO|nr:hypothetical protein [Chryseobacterium potabilaquae]CAA7196723.1 hypothetical protein CHRY9293_02798 [Chryseobacterium potabilaquae]
MKQLSKENLSEVEKFAFEVISKVNVNFSKEHENYEIDLAISEIRRYAAQSQLTPQEFFQARAYLSKGMLTDFDGEILKPYKKIDFEMFNQVEVAYIEYKKIDKQRELGIEKIKIFLEPPKPELTPEDKKRERIKFYRSDYERLQKQGKVLGTLIFYDLIKKKRLEKVSLKFVENILDNFVPETTGISHSKEPEQMKLTRIKKQDIKVFFIDVVVNTYIEKNKLKELSESEWIEYWESIFESTTRSDRN